MKRLCSWIFMQCQLSPSITATAWISAKALGIVWFIDVSKLSSFFMDFLFKWWTQSSLILFNSAMTVHRLSFVIYPILKWWIIPQFVWWWLIDVSLRLKLHFKEDNRSERCVSACACVCARVCVCVCARASVQVFLCWCVPAVKENAKYCTYSSCTSKNDHD